MNLNLKNWFPQAKAEFKAQAAELEAQVKQKNLNPLHGQMTLFELAISLAEEQIKVQNQVQTLCNSGVVKHNNNRLKINPAYYSDLARKHINTK